MAEEAVTATDAAGAADAEPTLDRDDTQALVVTGWKRLQHATYLFVTFDPARDPAAIGARKRWLAGVIGEVSRASDIRIQRESDTTTAAPGGPPRLQLAFTSEGMRALGATDADLAGLADEAKQGMLARARILGDGEAPGWELGGTGQPRLGALIACYAADDQTLSAMVADHTARVSATAATVVPESTTWIGSREHFGYADGLSQPSIPGTRAVRDELNEVPTGEIVLGYRNAYGRMPKGPRGRAVDGSPIDIGRNGTYLVIRKLEQHVEAFWSYFERQARALAACGHGPGPDCTAAELDDFVDWLAAKVIGRWRSGAPMALAPDHDSAAKAALGAMNKFEFAAHDPHGMRCPIGSHIRRANPRDARGAGDDPAASREVVRRHRILRRGRSWGPPLDRRTALTGQGDGHRRGLMFICLQTSIARGFEFVQQTWLSNLGFARLSREGDPLAGGEVDPRGTPHASFTIPVDPIRIRLHDMPRFVTTAGGDYFFMPSITALNYFAA